LRNGAILLIISADKLEFFRDLYDKAKSYRADNAKLDKWYEQYEGKVDPRDGHLMTRNISYELIESQISSNIPYPTVTPLIYTEGSSRNAKSIEKYCGLIRDKLPFERMNDLDERYTYIYGSSVWLVEWDDSIVENGKQGDISVRLIDPRDFYPQPGLNNVEDMEYLFVRQSATREDLARKYKVSQADLELAEAETDNGDGNETVNEIVCFYRDDDDHICRFVWSGDAVLSDISDYYSRKRNICKKCGQPEGICACEHPDYEETSDEYEELTEDIYCSTIDGKGETKVIPAMSPLYRDGKVVLEPKKATKEGEVKLVNGIPIPTEDAEEEAKMIPTRIPWYKPKKFPVVVRQNIRSRDNIWGQSDCAAIEYQQKEINKAYTRLHEKMMNSTVIPYKPKGLQFAFDNTVNMKVLNLDPQVPASQVGVIDTTVDITKDLVYTEKLISDAKKILGITDSYQGQADTTAKSGKAKQIQIERAAGRLDSKRALKGAAYADIDRVIFELCLAFADEPRGVSWRDSFGEITRTTFNRYDFVEYNEKTGEWFYDDGYLFATDKNSLVKEDDTVKWDRVLSEYTNGLYGEPNTLDALLLVWQSLDSKGYPDAARLVDYFRTMKKKIEAQTPTPKPTPTPTDTEGMTNEQV
jgi:hypothetical protein